MENQYIRENNIIEKTEFEKEIDLIKSIINARKDLKTANKNFEYAQEEMVDYYTYQIKANQAKLDYLIKLAKKKGLKVDMVKDIKFTYSENNEEAV